MINYAVLIALILHVCLCISFYCKIAIFGRQSRPPCIQLTPPSLGNTDLNYCSCFFMYALDETRYSSLKLLSVPIVSNLITEST